MTLEEMQDAKAAKRPSPTETVAARFGGKLPTPAEMAKDENRAMRKHAGVGIWGHSIEEAPRPVMESKRSYRAEKGRATRAKILALLTHQKTAADIEAETGISRNAVGQHLRMAAAQGLVMRDDSGRQHIWRLAAPLTAIQQEAAA